MKIALPILLVVLGLAQMAGDLSGFDALKGIAAATGASPAPKVFSSVKGLETFSTRFFVGFEKRRNECQIDVFGAVELTPEIYSRLRGPYNRRNVYGAAIAYAPVLPDGLRDAVLAYALCGDAPLLRELGIANPEPAADPVIRLDPRPGTSLDIPTRFPASCR